MRRTTALALAVLLAACSGDDPDPDRAAPSGTEQQVAGDHDEAGEVRVLARDRELVLVDGAGERRTLATLEDPSERFEHVALRPGDREDDTVLAVTSTDGRYELRYLVVDGDGPSDLYGFPWRMQIDEDVSEHADVAPRPVWAPDGGAVAWLEWDAEGTRLRTVGWMDEEVANNPSDDVAVYEVDDVPAGTQLLRWEGARSGATFVADDGEVEWRIELGGRDRAVAMPVE